MADSAFRGVLLLLCLSAAALRLAAAPLPVPPGLAAPDPASRKNETRILPVRQGQRAPAVHSVDTAEFLAVDEVRAELAHYGSPAGRRYMRTVLDRGADYLPFMRAAAVEVGVPVELAYLPIIESAFIPSAVSRSGAAGLWQFMLNSISPWDIRVDRWLDERRDFWKSTYGALRKLKGNYEVLGDWLLAVGAYNCGLGRMRRAVEAAGTDDFWALARGGYLPAETVAYIPKFLAVSHYASYPGRYGLPVTWNAPEWRRIDISGPVHLNRLAEAAGIPLRHLTDANAELNQPVTPPRASGYRLKVASIYADKVKEALRREDVNLVDVDTYTIQSGDTLYALSRHYEVDLDLILEFNPRLDPRLLRIGQTVLIPLMQAMPPYRGPSGGDPPSRFSATREYTIRRGDTLSSIARSFGTTPEALAFNNGITVEELIIPGQPLLVPDTQLVLDSAGGGEEIE